MIRRDAPWLPGSFTKNFAWGQSSGMGRLYENIKVGFANTLEPVSRNVYRDRVRAAGLPDHVPVNFFLFNYRSDEENMLLVDELVFQALEGPHSQRFDNLALFCLNFSRVGWWRGAQAGQRYPALWAMYYILERVSRDFSWDTSKITANDIRQFIASNPYRAQTNEKLGSNLHFLYKHGGLNNLSARRIERWWVDALFLALDRLIADDRLERDSGAKPKSLVDLLIASHFDELSGPKTPAKTFAMAHLLSLYQICGGLDRFSTDQIAHRVQVALPDYQPQLANDTRPQGALDPTNPRVLKSIPRACAPLATSVGFEIILADDLETFDAEHFVEDRADSAAASLQRDGIKPVLSAEELHRMMRGE